MSIHDQDHNPLRSVAGLQLPPPKKYEWGLQDLSADTAGRTEDNVMHKDTKGQVVRLSLSWRMVSIADGAKILQAFNDEFITVEYLDLLRGDYVTAEFYTGDRKGVLFNEKLGRIEEISFNIIEKKADIKGVGSANV